MANALRTWIQKLVNAVGNRLGSEGVINANSLENEIYKIETSEESKEYIKLLISGPEGTLTTYPKTVIKIPEGITEIARSAFYRQGSQISNSSDLSYTQMPKELPKTLQTIGSQAFSYVGSECSNINNKYAWVYNEQVDLIISENIEEIGEFAFRNCGINGNLEIFPKSDGTRTIKASAFRDMNGVKKIILHEGVNAIGENAFSGVKKRVWNDTTYMDGNDLYFPTTIQNIGKNWRANMGITKVYLKTLDCFSKIYNADKGNNSSQGFIFTLRSYTNHPMQVYVNEEPIGHTWEFNNDQILCTGILSWNTWFEKIVFDKNIQYHYLATMDKDHTIPEYFAYKSTALNEVYFKEPSEITTISDYAFQGCSNIKQMQIPSSVVTIASYALQCGSSSNKTTFIFTSEEAPSIQTTTFNTSYLNKIIVPKNCAATYKAATNWSTFADYIFEPNTITFNVDSSLLNNENVLYSIDNAEEQQFTQASFTGENLSTLKVTSKSADVTVLVGTTEGGSEIGTVANASTVFTFESDTTVYITKQ